MRTVKVKPRHHAGRRSKVRPDLEINKLAAQAGISASFFGGVLNGKKTPSLAVAERMARVMGLSGVDELREELKKYKLKGDKFR